MTLSLDPPDDGLEVLKGVRRHQELVLRETCWTVGFLPSSGDVEHVVELGQIDDLVLVVSADPVERLADQAQ